MRSRIKNFIFKSPDKTLINHHQHFDKKNFRVDSSGRLLLTDTEPRMHGRIIINSSLSA